MNESDLCKLRDVLAKPTLQEAIEAVEKTLRELGYFQIINTRESFTTTSSSNKWGEA